jgi:hypothetical protein
MPDITGNMKLECSAVWRRGKQRDAAWKIFCWFLKAKSFGQKYYLLVSLKYMP